jgi:hypothetical protein
MKLATLRLAASSLVLASALPGAVPARPSPGSAADFSFREPPLNSLGVKSSAELRGKPIVIDFWGQR